MSFNYSLAKPIAWFRMSISMRQSLPASDCEFFISFAFVIFNFRSRPWLKGIYAISPWFSWIITCLPIRFCMDHMPLWLTCWLANRISPLSFESIYFCQCAWRHWASYWWIVRGRCWRWVGRRCIPWLWWESSSSTVCLEWLCHALSLDKPESNWPMDFTASPWVSYRLWLAEVLMSWNPVFPLSSSGHTSKMC